MPLSLYRRPVRLVAIVAILSLTLTNPAFAADDVTANSPLSGLYACKAETDPMARLACYDAAVGIVAAKEAAQEIVTIDANAAKDIRREAFGFTLPSLPKLGLGRLGGDDNDADSPELIELPVASVSKTRNGVVIKMKNGQVWRGVNGRLTYVPKGDLIATIRTGSIGSYRLSLSNGKDTVRGLGVRREE